MRYVGLLIAVAALAAALPGCGPAAEVQSDQSFHDLVVNLDRSGGEYSACLLVHADWQARPAEVTLVRQWGEFARRHGPDASVRFPVLKESDAVYREHFQAACPRLPTVMVQRDGKAWRGEVVYKRSGAECRVHAAPTVSAGLFQRLRGRQQCDGGSCDGGQCNPAPAPAPVEPIYEPEVDKRSREHREIPWRERTDKRLSVLEVKPPPPNVAVNVVPERVTPAEAVGEAKSDEERDFWTTLVCSGLLVGAAVGGLSLRGSFNKQVAAFQA
jgi:hypothetical protein